MNIPSKLETGERNSLSPPTLNLTRPLIVRILAAGEILWEGDADSVTLPSSDGEMGVLRGHIAIKTSLVLGILRIRAGGQSLAIFLVGGWAEVEGDEVLVRAMGAERGDRIDPQQAQMTLEAARMALQQAQEQAERQKVANNLKKAQIRLKAAQSLPDRLSYPIRENNHKNQEREGTEPSLGARVLSAIGT